MDLDELLLNAEELMEKAANYLKDELRGVRTGRATTALVEFIKVDYYGSPTDLRQLALISVSDGNQIAIKPFDAGSTGEIVKAIQQAGLGLNPIGDGKLIRVPVPALTGERRTQLVGSVKQMGEQAKISIRNARRDANKHVDQDLKDKSTKLGEDEAETVKTEIQDLLKQYEGKVEEVISQKVKEIEQV